MADHTFQVTIPEEDYRAFILVVPDADQWVEDAVRNKVRKCLIRVAEAVAQHPQSLLKNADKQEIETEMAKQGDVMKAPKHYSDVVKRMIASKTTMKTRAERDAEIRG